MGLSVVSCSCFGYITTFQLGCNPDKVYQVGIAKSFYVKTLQNKLRAIRRLEPAAILKTSPVCSCRPGLYSPQKLHASVLQA